MFWPGKWRPLNIHTKLTPAKSIAMSQQQCKPLGMSSGLSLAYLMVLYGCRNSWKSIDFTGQEKERLSPSWSRTNIFKQTDICKYLSPKICEKKIETYEIILHQIKSLMHISYHFLFKLAMEVKDLWKHLHRQFPQTMWGLVPSVYKKSLTYDYNWAQNFCR